MKSEKVAKKKAIGSDNKAQAVKLLFITIKIIILLIIKKILGEFIWSNLLFLFSFFFFSSRKKQNLAEDNRKIASHFLSDALRGGCARRCTCAHRMGSDGRRGFDSSCFRLVSGWLGGHSAVRACLRRGPALTRGPNASIWRHGSDAEGFGDTPRCGGAGSSSDDENGFSPVCARSSLHRCISPFPLCLPQWTCARDGEYSVLVLLSLVGYIIYIYYLFWYFSFFPFFPTFPSLFHSLFSLSTQFYHGYESYMQNAYGDDELKPLSCSGRRRGVDPSRGHMDDCLGKCVFFASCS